MSEGLTNEELVAEIQAGKTELITELWQGVRRFVYQKAMFYVQTVSGSGVYDADDLIMSAFEFIYKAIENYSPAKGKFLTLYGFYLKNAFNVAAGIRSESDKAQRRFDNNCISLDEPITGCDGSSDMIAEIVGECESGYEDVENSIFIAELHNRLENLIRTLPEQQQDCIKAHYYEGKTKTDVMAAHGESPQSFDNIERNLRRKLRSTAAGADLAAFVGADGNYNYQNCGLDSFLRNNQSETEAAAFRLMGIK